MAMTVGGASSHQYLFTDLEGWLLKNWLRLPLGVAVEFERSNADFMKYAKTNLTAVPLEASVHAREALLNQIKKTTPDYKIPPVYTIARYLRELFPEYHAPVLQSLKQSINHKVPEELRKNFWNLDPTMFEEKWLHSILGVTTSPLDKYFIKETAALE